MKKLNLYCGIGGNRQLWGKEKVTAVECDADIAAVYADKYPQDDVIIGDAHDYLLNHYDEFDFVWSSPPCPTHSQYRFNVGFKAKGFKAVYPDMTLYEEIILLKHYFQGLYAVENVVSYYIPLIQPQKVGRHYIWANFPITPISIPPSGIGHKNKVSDYTTHDLDGYKLPNKRKILRNCVNPSLGRHVLMCAK